MASKNSIKTITVYREDPAWDKDQPWFMLGVGLLQSLFVAKYQVHRRRQVDRDHPAP